MTKLSQDPLKRAEQLVQLHERGEMATHLTAFEPDCVYPQVNLKAQVAINKWLSRQGDDGK